MISGRTKPGRGGQGQGDGLQVESLHQGLLSRQLHLPLARQQQECQVQLVFAQSNYVVLSIRGKL